MSATPFRRAVFAFLPLLLLTGCGGGSVNQAKFEKLKVGMTSQDVEVVLGKDGKPIPVDEIANLMREALNPKGGSGLKLDLPDLNNARGVRWGDDKKSITVIYMGDRVSRIFKKGF
jgi:hypothetical protein